MHGEDDYSSQRFNQLYSQNYQQLEGLLRLFCSCHHINAKATSYLCSKSDTCLFQTYSLTPLSNTIDSVYIPKPKYKSLAVLYQSTLFQPNLDDTLETTPYLIKIPLCNLLHRYLINPSMVFSDINKSRFMHMLSVDIRKGSILLEKMSQ